jgi:hypothetical protein
MPYLLLPSKEDIGSNRVSSNGSNFQLF